MQIVYSVLQVVVITESIIWLPSLYPLFHITPDKYMDYKGGDH